jgi:methyl-accepting chemotaxis protein
MLRFSKKVPVEAKKVDNHKLDEIKLALKKSQEKISALEGIKSAMPDPYYIRDMDYNIVEWPQVIVDLTGYSAAEAKKMKCYEIFKAAVCPPNMDCPTQGCIKAKQFLRDVAVDVYGKNGKTIHSLVSNAGIYDEQGNPTGAVEVIKDNTVVQKNMDSISQSIIEIENVSNNLHAIVNTVHELSEKVSSNSVETLHEIQNSANVGTKVSSKANESEKYINETSKTMNNIENSVKFFDENISLLNAKAAEIVEFVKVIQDISEKTNLLAINASIEAAHAGEVGRGFKVVADGIRELSKNSKDSALSIKETIDAVNDLIYSVDKSLTKTQNDAHSGTTAMKDLVGFVNEISTAIKELMYMFKEIESAASLTSDAVSEQHNSVKEVSNMSDSLNGIAKKLTREFDSVIKAIQHTDMG